MPDIYESFTEQEVTSGILDEYRVTNFAYDDTAFNDTSVPENVVGQDAYDYNAHNNIPKTPELSTATQTLGLGGRSGVFKRSFWNHYAGRISYNLNKAVQALMSVLGSFRSDYSENISEYSEYAAYAVGDVCYRLNDDEIIFYRCIAPIAAPAGDFNGVYWEKPEEELAYSRPAVGVPVMWFEKVPDWAIRFDDGGSHRWTDVPALNFDDFRSMVTLTADGFRVPNYSGKTPMFEGGDNEVQTGYSGDDFTACVQEHTHGARALTFSIPASSTAHTHPDTTCDSCGDHRHQIVYRNNYKFVQGNTPNTTSNRVPVNGIQEWAKNTITNAAGNHGHTGNTSTGNIPDHPHQLTVTGRTGAVKEATGGNPDGFQSCWIVRYK